MLPFGNETEPCCEGARLVQAADAHPEVEPFGRVAELCSATGREPCRCAEDGLCELQFRESEAFNVNLHRQFGEERLVLIDWPQIVDVIGNPQGFDFLERDATTMATWFVRKGLDVDPGELVGDLVAEATSRF